MLADSSLWKTLATHTPGAIRFQSPELIDASQLIVTKQSDIYAYALTCYVSMISDWTHLCEYYLINCFLATGHRQSPILRVPERSPNNVCRYQS